jgi:serine/threonine-protein kinase
VVVAGVVAAILLREGVSQEPPAVAAGTPTVAPTVVTKATVKPTPKPTPTPTPKPKETPTPKKTPKKSPSKPAETGTVAQLRTLAQLLRQGDHVSRPVREAAKDLDQAAKALGEDKEGEASEQYRSALRRLGTAQRTHQWQPTPQQFLLIAALSRDLGRAGYGDGDRDNDERDSDE